MNNALMFSKATDEWSTPQDFFDALNAEFNFTLDAAASQSNHKCAMWLGPDHPDSDRRDALVALKTIGSVWMNPPYSRCMEFIGAASQWTMFGDVPVCVCLVPARTDTRWWHAHVWDNSAHCPLPGVEIRFIKGRLKFGGATAGAPFPSVVIIFRSSEAV